MEVIDAHDSNMEIDQKKLDDLENVLKVGEASMDTTTTIISTTLGTTTSIDGNSDHNNNVDGNTSPNSTLSTDVQGNPVNDCNNTSIGLGQGL